MIQPKPHKLVCPKCNNSKTIRPKNDVLDPMDMLHCCPKCDVDMVIVEHPSSGVFDKLKDMFD